MAQHGLYTPEQQAAAGELADRIRELGLRTVRLIVVDQHGIPRGKSLDPAVAIAAMRNGLDFSGAIYSLDTGNQVFVPAFAAGGGFGIDELTGFPDVVLVPDPATFQVLPWADRTGWMLCDVYFSSGEPMPLDGRGLMRRQLAALGEAGLDYLAGIEVEYYIVKNEQATIIPENAGFTPVAPASQRVGARLPVPLRGPAGQRDQHAGDDPRRPGRRSGCCPARWRTSGAPGRWSSASARSAGWPRPTPWCCSAPRSSSCASGTGLLATFMCRPALPNFFSSGWHLHESLLSRTDGRNVFSSADEALSQVGRQFVAGLLEHAMPMTVFATPTVNGYKRFRPYSFAPDRVCWAVENRGALIRVQGAPGDANSHVENRMGEPAANPYLYMAANIAAGLDGMRRKADPPPPVEADPYAAEAPMLPTSLATAVEALDKDSFYREAFGDTLVDYLLTMKRAEVSRYEAALADNPPADPGDVTDWEMREYFEFY